MKIKFNKDGSAVVTEPGKKSREVSQWTTSRADQTAKHVSTWDHGDKKRSSLSKGDISALKDFANEHFKKKK